MARKELPLVTVNILSWNRKEELRKTLQELKKQSYPSIDIIVVDNNSTDGTIEMVECEFPEVRLMKLASNIGIEGYNIGFDEAKGKYIVVLDDDSYPEKDAIAKCVEKFENDSSIGIIAFHIVNAIGETVTKYWPKEVATFWGCGVAVMKEALRKSGYYDKDFFLYRNEQDLCIRFSINNYKIIYCNEITAYHNIPSSRIKATDKGMFYSTRNNFWFTIKYMSGRYLWLGLLRNFYFNFTKGVHCKVFKGFVHGYLSGFKDIKKMTRKRVVVSRPIMNFYFKNLDIYEPIFSRTIRLLRKRTYEDTYFKV